MPFIRPKKLATAKAHHPDVVNHALKFIEKKDKIEFDYVVMLQPTTVLLEIHHILIKLLINFLKRTMSL